MQIFYLILTTPILYDYYNYGIGEPKFFILLHEFLQVMLKPSVPITKNQIIIFIRSPLWWLFASTVIASTCHIKVGSHAQRREKNSPLLLESAPGFKYTERPQALYNHFVNFFFFCIIYDLWLQVIWFGFYWQCMAFLGALLFFVGMKNSILRKQQKKKAAPKPKAAWMCRIKENQT